MGAKKKRGGARVQHPCGRCGKPMRGIGTPHRAGAFSRDRRTKMVCRTCLRVMKGKDRYDTVVLYLLTAAVIVLMTIVEMCVTRPG